MTIKEAILNYLKDKNWVWVWEIEKHCQEVKWARASTVTAQLRVLRQQGDVEQLGYIFLVTGKKQLKYRAVAKLNL